MAQFGDTQDLPAMTSVTLDHGMLSIFNSVQPWFVDQLSRFDGCHDSASPIFTTMPPLPSSWGTATTALVGDMSDSEQSVTETDAILIDQIAKEPDTVEPQTKAGNTTHQWNIVVTLVVPIHFDSALWPPSEEWTTGPWPDDERSGRTSEDRSVLHRSL